MSKSPKSFLSTLKNAIVIEPKTTDVSKQHCVLILHGLGDTEKGWLDVASQFSKVMPEYRFILPRAPVQPVTLNYGMSMTSWYDINGLDSKSREDHEGVKKSSQLIQKIINEQISDFGISPDRIALCGFSQGGALSLYTGIQMASQKTVLGCVVGLSSYLPCRDHLAPSIKLTKTLEKPPILMCHGTSDEVVSIKWAEGSKKVLEDSDWLINWKTYPNMGHSACPSEIRDFYAFLKINYKTSKSSTSGKIPQKKSPTTTETTKT